jgi:hypothetical protein
MIPVNHQRSRQHAHIVGIVTFHIYLEPKGIAIAIVVAVLELYLAWAYRGAFAPMLAFRVKPGPR